MEKKKTIFDFGAEVLMVFAVTMIFMMCFTAAWGEETMAISKMYTLGSKGVSVEVMAQFLALSFLVALITFVCDLELIQSKLPELVRIVLMLALIIAVIIVFASVFDWFPMTMWQPWASFFILFGICVAVSFGMTFLKVKIENKKMEEGLESMRRQWEEEENEKHNK